MTNPTPEPAMTVCVFCEIVAGREPAEIVHRDAVSIAIIPHHPVVPGHTLVLPIDHVADFTERPSVTAAVAYTAAVLAVKLGLGPCNLITSKGTEATQTVFHLHWHLVPRREDDGLALPWTPR